MAFAKPPHRITQCTNTPYTTTTTHDTQHTTNTHHNSHKQNPHCTKTQTTAKIHAIPTPTHPRTHAHTSTFDPLSLASTRGPLASLRRRGITRSPGISGIRCRGRLLVMWNSPPPSPASPPPDHRKSVPPAPLIDAGLGGGGGGEGRKERREERKGEGEKGRSWDPDTSSGPVDVDVIVQLSVKV